LIIPVVTSFFACIVINRFGFYKTGKFCFILFSNAAAFFYSGYFGFGASIHLLFFSYLGVSLILFDPDQKISIGIGAIIPLFTYFLLHYHYFISPFFPIQDLPFSVARSIHIFSSVTVFIIVWLYHQFYFSSNEHIKSDLKVQKNELEKTNHKLQDAYNQLKESKLAAEKLSHHVAFATLTRGIAHEIKNPMAMLLTRSELVMQRPDDPKAVQKFATIIIQNIERLNKLVNSMLSYGSHVSRSIETFNLSTVLHDLVQLSGPNCHLKRIKLKEAIQDSLKIEADKTFVYQSLLNLVVNAIQFTPEDGTITISAEWSTFVDAKGKESPGVLISVIDTGKGISQKDLPHIFDPYFTTKASQENIGLGLSMAYRAIAENGGTITVESKFNHGTTFKVRFPLAE